MLKFGSVDIVLRFRGQSRKTVRRLELLPMAFNRELKHDGDGDAREAGTTPTKKLVLNFTLEFRK